MTKPSTKNLEKLPDISQLKLLCKALATLDAILSPDWESRYYSYNKNWDEKNGEELFEMRDGSGDEFQILFCQHGAVINGFAHESKMNGWTDIVIKPKKLIGNLRSIAKGQQKEMRQTIWKGVVDTLPQEFHSFIFSEPVKSKGTTFCIWRKNNDPQWHIGDIQFPSDVLGDGSAELLYILDNDPVTYKQWAIEYYEEQFEDGDLKIEWVKHVYAGNTITKELVKSINPLFTELDSLKTDLNAIGIAEAL